MYQLFFGTNVFFVSSYKRKCR